MKCPTDSATLVMSERGGVEIDYCPECRGIWLDRGELDKIITRAEAEFSASTPAAPAAPVVTNTPPQQYQDPRSRAPQYGNRDDDRNRGYGDRDDDRRYDGRGKKRESWLGALFD
ncbi:zf-TFIIB domain-containing protein [Cryobacterium sp. CG_9.6]|uniref:TFIIB-type zinc ribbon-containing protein n=1 Tax=Cryobacterium sp. CG_9.6 TaxID=2760710 RepID=UPI0024744217|nr:zf-TFIIB domain-containing protein [Cryobacterium sp. CG_9.6]MDH6237924.1 Zn-finger nucleic acid-binding protein [Cryobacterium sp. CG_9.6]